MMALLVFVLFAHVDHIQNETVLEKFQDLETCMEARDYVSKEMEKSYPGEQGKVWILICRVPGREA